MPRVVQRQGESFEMKLKLKLITKILIIAFFVGLSLALYPSFSNYWNLKHSTRAINEFSESMSGIDEEKYEKLWLSAIEYNGLLRERVSSFSLPADLEARYYQELNVSENGLFGYIEIPSIDVSLPLYHGTSDSVLQVGIGHLDWSSLPTGGESTHCVVSGHRGLPSAKLFTDLNKLRMDDVFTVHVMNEILTYEVDQVTTVLPNELGGLVIKDGYDYCTLVTCTPYGINSHRLLVRGHRIETTQAGATVISEAVLVDYLIVAIYLGAPLVMLLFLVVMLKKPVNKKKLELELLSGGQLPEIQVQNKQKPGRKA